METVLDKVKNDRENYDRLGMIYQEDHSVNVTFENVAGVPCYWFAPEHLIEGMMVVYIHVSRSIESFKLKVLTMGSPVKSLPSLTQSP